MVTHIKVYPVLIITLLWHIIWKPQKFWTDGDMVITSNPVVVIYFQRLLIRRM